MNRIYAYRSAHFMTQMQLAIAVGVSISSITKWERLADDLLPRKALAFLLANTKPVEPPKPARPMGVRARKEAEQAYRLASNHWLRARNPCLWRNDAWHKQLDSEVARLWPASGAPTLSAEGADIERAALLERFTKS